MKFFIILTIPFLIAIISGYAEDSAKMNLLTLPVNAQKIPVKSSENKAEISDADKLAIIKLLISMAKVNGRDICENKKTIYFSKSNLPKYVLDRFPKKIMNCKTILFGEDTIKGDFKFDYHRFGNWKIQSSALVYITSCTQFWGGNVGGVNYTVFKSNGKWIVNSAKGWAMAH